MDVNWNLLMQAVVIGIASGSLIALIALGYTIVYGIVEIINFAHGEVFMMGAILAMTIVWDFRSDAIVRMATPDRCIRSCVRCVVRL